MSDHLPAVYQGGLPEVYPDDAAYHVNSDFLGPVSEDGRGNQRAFRWVQARYSTYGVFIVVYLLLVGLVANLPVVGWLLVPGEPLVDAVYAVAVSGYLARWIDPYRTYRGLVLALGAELGNVWRRWTYRRPRALVTDLSAFHPGRTR